MLTKKNYYTIWKSFNAFFVKLDVKPNNWEDRITLFMAHLINEKKKVSTIKSYISAIKAVLADINVTVNEDRYLINSLTRACKLHSDCTIQVRLPIQRTMLNIILKQTNAHFNNLGQFYLASMYTALFSTTYFGLF